MGYHVGDLMSFCIPTHPTGSGQWVGSDLVYLVGDLVSYSMATRRHVGELQNKYSNLRIFLLAQTSINITDVFFLLLQLTRAWNEKQRSITAALTCPRKTVITQADCKT